jgi:GT2 family glycosyltransferase
LEVALASIAPQAAQARAEVVVVDDAGPAPERRARVEHFGARYVAHTEPMGLNHARNTGVRSSTGALVVFVDDDVEVAPDWLKALLRAAGRHPDVAVFTGPIHPRLEGRSPRSCGREAPPLTALDLGAQDTTMLRYAWGTNMTIRRTALERAGPFDVTLSDGGDEQEWQERLQAGGDRQVLYVAGAALYHRRAGADAALASLMFTALARGRAARRFDAARGQAPSLLRELATLAACFGHVLRRRCPAGMTMVAHSAGRLQQALRNRRLQGPSGDGRAPSSVARARRGGVRGRSASRDGPPARPRDDFLSGESGTVGGVGAVNRRALDKLESAFEVTSGRRRRLRRAARSFPERRRVLVLGVQRPEHAALASSARRELESSRHDVQVYFSPYAGRAKFEHLNLLLGTHSLAARDWLVLVDDDVKLPRGFLDSLLFLAERFYLDLVQPAHSRSSHAAWRVTRRRRASVVRETAFVEIGPVTAFARSTFSVLLPFPPLRMGWGLDAHWAALAREHGWRCGVLDAVSVRHDAAPAGAAYSREAAVAEARTFLAHRPYLPAGEIKRTLVTHRHW